MENASLDSPMLLTLPPEESWSQFLQYIRGKLSQTAFENWFAPIRVIEASDRGLTLAVPNIFVQAYLLDNYKKDLISFVPLNQDGEPAISFVIGNTVAQKESVPPTSRVQESESEAEEALYQPRLNQFYRFENFIEGPSNQFVKSAALGIAAKPSRSYNPLFIHGGVGLGKTHLLHAIGHYVRQHHKKMRVQCITTEGFINDLVDHLRNKSVDKMKRFYRSLDVLLVDDIQFLQNRLNFEEEFCNTFESLINQNKQIVITSDKPPSQLKLSERIVARMEWGLVAHVGAPDLETRVAILQHKAEQRGLVLPQGVAFYIAENIYANVRQLEGAINRLTAQCRLLDKEITEEIAQMTLSELFQLNPKQKVSVEQIIKGVAAVFQVRISDLRGTSRTKEVALARQVAMYLSKECIQESLIMIGAAFGKTHSTILHACKTIEHKLENDELLKRQVALCRRQIGR